jgi:hypothetical protein
VIPITFSGDAQHRTASATGLSTGWGIRSSSHRYPELAFLGSGWKEQHEKVHFVYCHGFAVICYLVPFGVETAFNGCKLADVKGKQADARLIFSDDAKSIIVRSLDRDIAKIPYESIDKVSYDYAKKHRVTQGAIVMVASLGAGAIVMLTKSKSHWLYIDFHEQNAPKSLVLRMDKNEYKKIFDAVKSHTGKEVEFTGEAAKQQEKQKDKKN